MKGETVLEMAAPSPDQFSILVVEDEVLIRLMVADQLRDDGFSVVEASSADEAITILQSRVPIDLVFTDLRMPGFIDGLALATLLRETRPDMKLILASGDALVGKKMVPADAFFRKPYDLKTVMRRIKELLAIDHGVSLAPSTASSQVEAALVTADGALIPSLSPPLNGLVRTRGTTRGTKGQSSYS